jgi:hypothetical protein
MGIISMKGSSFHADDQDDAEGAGYNRGLFDRAVSALSGSSAWRELQLDALVAAWKELQLDALVARGKNVSWMNW